MEKQKHYLVVILLSLVLTCLTVIVPNGVDSREDLAELRFGLPFAFVEQESTLTPPDDRFPAFVSVSSPWETPTRLRPLIFFVDFIVVAQIVIAMKNMLKFKKSDVT